MSVISYVNNSTLCANLATADSCVVSTELQFIINIQFVTTECEILLCSDGCIICTDFTTSDPCVVSIDIQRISNSHLVTAECEAFLRGDSCIICTDFATSDCCIICIKLQFTSCINATTTLLVIASCSNTQILANYFALAHSDACSLNQTCASACVNSCTGNAHSSTYNHICCIHFATCQSHGIVGFNSVCIDSSVVNSQLRSNYINLLSRDGAVVHGHIISSSNVNIACTSTDATIIHGHSASGCSHVHVACLSANISIIHGHSASRLHVHILCSCNRASIDGYILACNEINILSSCFNFTTIYKYIVSGCSQCHISTTHACTLSHIDVCFLVSDNDIAISLEILINFDDIVYTISYIGNRQIFTNYAHSMYIQIASFIVATNDGCIAMLRIYIYILQLIQLARQSQVGASLCHSVGCSKSATSLSDALARG